MATGLLLTSCQKEDVEKKTVLLSEIIYGDWEIRESISVATYGDGEYHDLPSPYLYFYRFNEDGTFNLYFDDTPDFPNPLPFEVNDQDSLLILTHPYKVHEFNEGMIDMRMSGWEGPSGFKIYKRE